MRGADYIAEKLREAGITQVFVVTGGQAMHLDDALGHAEGLHCTYQHHEQACAMAAEAYTRTSGRMAAVCVTSGPGAINALSGILGAWMESVPVIVISGQVRTAVTVRSTGLNIRTMGVQEYDVTKAAQAMTKYAVMVTDMSRLRYEMEKALYLARDGRPGPVWVDVPLDIQGGPVEPERLEGFEPAECEISLHNTTDEPSDSYAPKTGEALKEAAIRILDKIEQADRPVLFGGAAVRASGAYESFREMADLLGVPVTAGASSVDLMPYAAPLFVGVSGIVAGRAGNFALQNADVYLSIGSRQSISQTGYSYKTWAREAYTILNDIDPEELKKPNLHVSYPVVADTAALMEELVRELRARGCTKEAPLFKKTAWFDKCQSYKRNYPVVTEAEKGPMPDGRSNTYAFFDALSEAMEEGQTLVASVGTSRVVCTQAFRVKEGQRVILNSQTAAMGDCLPFAVGTATALRESCTDVSLHNTAHAGRTAGPVRPDVTLVTGEGSFMMNLQELQTIATNKLPVRVFIVDNEGYHSIRQTQRNFFGGKPVGIGEESGDLGFPDFKKVADAFGFNYAECLSNDTIRRDVAAAMAAPMPLICRVAVSKTQATEPKAASRKLADGSMVSSPLEDMAPFLTREELAANMLIPLTEEELRS